MPETCRTARDEVEDLQYGEGPRSFIPLDRLRAFFEPEKIQEILSCSCRQCQEDLQMFKSRIDRESYVKRIRGSSELNDLTKTFYSTFGLLLCLEHPLFIIGFLDHNCNDYILESWAIHLSRFSKDHLEQYTGEYRRDRKRFDRFARKFTDNLSRFAVPHLDSHDFSQYDANVVLPFIEEVEIGQRRADDGHWTSEGANGRVYAFRIHPEYNRLPDVDSRIELARKRIETTQPLAYLERSNIHHVQQFEDNHIVKLIKAYGHGESINLIFPRAWTNLDHLLRNPAFKYGAKRGARLELADAWKQLLGISKAMKKLHGLSDGDVNRSGTTAGTRLCIHFDLKPDNILVEREDGNWVITDFGQAALTERRSGQTPQVGGHFGTDAYAPPEIDDTSMEFGRAYDIWSLGCIMLEVTTFMVLGHAGLNGTSAFEGLDATRKAMPEWAKHGDERFFYKEAPNGRHIVKKEIQEFMASLGRRHARSLDGDTSSSAFLAKVLDLVELMLKPNATERVDIIMVVDTLSSALQQASMVTLEHKQHQVVAASDENVLGGPRLNQVGLWHRSGASNAWQITRLEILENHSGFVRLHCWARGQEPSNISFRRREVKLIPRYAFWDPTEIWRTRTWMELLFLSAGRHSEVPNSEFSFNGTSGLKEARVIQAVLTSQNVVGSFSLSQFRLKKSLSTRKTFKGLIRLIRHTDDGPTTEIDGTVCDLGSATIQIWVEQARESFPESEQELSLVSQGAESIRVRHYKNGGQDVPLCRVCIYIHKQRFICTVRIDVNWVLNESENDKKILSFRPHPPRRKMFYVSWLRPTPEEFACNDEFPAGIPLDPSVLQYYEDLDSIEVEDLQLTFLSAHERDAFKWKYLETKRDWDLERQKTDTTVEVNRMPQSTPQVPLGISYLPVPRRKKSFSTNTGVDKELQSNSSINTTRSKHDSIQENNAVVRQDPNSLMVPPR